MSAQSVLPCLALIAVGCGESTDAPLADALLPDGPVDAPDPSRSTTDLPDDVTGPQVHVIYAVASDGEDRELDLDGSIGRSVNAFNNWLGMQTGGPKLRLDVANGALDITFVRLPRTSAAYLAEGVFVRDRLEEDLAAQLQSTKLYAVYFDGDNGLACGGGAWPPSLVGRVGALYLRSQLSGAPACDTNALGGPQAPQYLEFAMLHELVHTLGGVATCAPNHALSGHTSENPSDLMYAGNQPWTPSVLDDGRNDYYGTGRTDCFDLARSALMDPMPANAVLPPGW